VNGVEILTGVAGPKHRLVPAGPPAVVGLTGDIGGLAEPVALRERLVRHVKELLGAGTLGRE